MSRDLNGMRIAILATDGVERIELEEPRGALYGAGAVSDVLSLHGGEIQARQFDMISAGTIPVDWVVGDARADAYDALLLPGGTVNPDQLRMNGAEVVDTEVVVDGQFTTSRSPDDLRAFCPAIVEQFAARRVAH
jgi:protease I